MHSLIEDHPEFVEFARQRTKAAVDRDRFTADAVKAQKAYEAASLHALESGGRIPDAPQAAAAGEQAYMLRLNQIERRSNEWMASNADELRAQLLGREDDLVAEAAGHVERLDHLAAEAEQLRASLAHVHMRAGLGRPESTGTNLDLLIRCARTNTRMCQPPFVMAMQYIGGVR